VVQTVMAAEGVINKARFDHPAGGMASTTNVQAGSVRLFA